MSKSLNFILPAIGGTAFILASAVSYANWNYGGEKIVGLEQRLKVVEERASSAKLAVSEHSKRADALAKEIVAVKAKSAMINSGGIFAEPAPDRDGIYGLGRYALMAEIAAWDVNVLPDGRGLPEGRGDAYWGEEVFAEKCASCHGDFAEGVDNWPVLAGGFDTLADEDPVKTVGSYWPHLSTVWDYVHRSMPFGEAQSLTVDETYAIVAYILYSNDLVDDDFELSYENFGAFEMYNKDGFVIDDRAQAEYSLWRSEPCMQNCKADVKITMRASILDVTPEEDGEKTIIKTDNSAVPEEGAVSTTVAVKVNLDPSMLEKGRKVFKKCSACHQVGDGAKNRSGPHLNAVIGRVIGDVEGFKYSKILSSAHDEGRQWDVQALSEFLEKPRSYFKGTKMAFSGLKSKEDITAVVEYLKSFNDTKPVEVVQAFVVDSDILAIDGDLEYGEYLASECMTCHREKGGDEGIPLIHGMDRVSVITALQAYREKYRDNSVMQMVAGRLSDDEIAALAVYFESLEN